MAENPQADVKKLSFERAGDHYELRESNLTPVS